MVHFDTSRIDQIPDGEQIQSAWETCADDISEMASSIRSATHAWYAISDSLAVPQGCEPFYTAPNEAMFVMNDTADTVRLLSNEMPAITKFIADLNRDTRQVHKDIESFHTTYPDSRMLDPNLSDDVKLEYDDKKTRIEGAINRIKADFDGVEQRFDWMIEGITLARAAAVTMHFPATGAFAFLDADNLVDALLTGTSSNPAVDFEKLQVLLAEMSPEEIAALQAQFPTINMLVPPLGTDPAANAQWWAGLPQSQRNRITEAMPGLVGNLEGLDYATRREANEHNLDIMRERVAEQRSGQRDWGLTEKQLDGIEKLDETLQEARRRYAVQGPYPDESMRPNPAGFLSFDPLGDDGEPLASLVIGDLDTADYQTWWVHGMGQGAHINPMGALDEAGQIRDSQRNHLPPGASTATVIFLGYDAPDGPVDGGAPDVLQDHNARDGGQRLAEQLNGQNYVNEQRGGEMPYVSVAGHSYGTTTMAFALTQIDFEVDSAVMLGSAGIDTDAATHASDLRVKDDPNTGRPAVYAGTAMADSTARMPINSTGLWFGDPRVSPTNEAFGANVFEVDGDDSHAAVSRHDTLHSDSPGYLTAGTQSYDAVGAFSVGEGDHIRLWDEARRDDDDSDVMVEPDVYEDLDGNPEVIHEP